MAKMTFKLPEETIRKMEALGSHYDAVTSAVLEEGVKPLYDAAKQSLSFVIGQATKEPSVTFKTGAFTSAPRPRIAR